MSEHPRKTRRDETASYDEERMLSRLERVREGLVDVDADLTRLHRLASVGVAAGMVAHELRNIMTPIQSYAQMARRAPEDAALVAKALANAQEGAGRAVAIAESILGLVVAAQEPEGGASANVEEVVELALGALVRPPERVGVRVRREIEAGITAGIEGVDLQHVLVNLFANAITAMPGGGTLTVRACSTGNTDARGAQHRVRIEVLDTGRGFDPSVAGRVFEPFVTSEGEDPRGEGAPSGSGLGLAICKRLVTRAGGTIDAVPNADRGTVFRIALP